MATGEALYTDANGDVYYDLTTKTGDQAEIDGTLFQTLAAEGSSGTGLIQAFVRTQATGDEAGYNTDARPLSYDENSSPQFTISLLLNQVPKVTIDGIEYYEFRLDINQTNNNPLLSLNELKVYTSTTANLSGLITDPSFTGSTELIWDLDDQNIDGTDDTDNTVLLDYSLQAGSGKSDMFFYIPVSEFNGANEDTTYVVLYTEFGNTGTLDAADGGDIDPLLYGDYSSNDGFEEWSVSKELEGPLISGFKWHDENGNGLWDDGEEGLGGWKIDYELTYEEGHGSNAVTVTVTGSTTTSDGTVDVDGDGIVDPAGFYVIPIPLGANNNTQYTLTLTEVLTGGWANTYDGDATANLTTTFTFSENDLTDADPDDISGGFELTETMNFGNFELFDISGIKYTDENGDGAIVGDLGLGGVTIFIDVNGNQLNDDGAENQTVTASDGSWSFTGLDQSYAGLFVYEVLPSGYVQTLGQAGYEITGGSGNDQTGLNFANFELFDISGTKYTDENGDGLTAGDDGLAGVTIFIDLDDSGDLSAGDETTLTDADGNWSFTDLDWTYAGKMVFEVLPSGHVQTLGAAGYEITGTSGADQTGLDFANFELFDVSGTKYTDENGDGLTAGDDGLAGVTIFIDLDDSGDLSAGDETTLTDADGNWSFEDLDWTYAGKMIFEVLPSGYTQTLGAAGYEITGTSGADQTGLDFANFELFDISGTKYLDANGDGSVVGDSGLGGITIFIDLDDSGDLSAGDETTLTDADGNWSFTDLDWTYAGKFVFEVLPSGYIQTLGMAGYEITGTSGADQEGLDFANFELFDVSGTKYTDENGDGLTAGDVGLEGVTIFIDLDDSGDLSAGDETTLTDADGNWSFEDLDWTYAGKMIFEVLPSGYTQTLGAAGYEITGTSGADQTGLDFANFELFDISGTKYTDENGDGLTAGDDGLAGVTIFIDLDDSGDLSAGDETTLTDADGNWSFTDLDWTYAGKMVFEVLPSGYTQTLGAAGYEITGTSGADQEDLDFANFELFDVSGTKYTDENGDGLTAGDVGLEGVTIFIDRDDSGDLSAGDETTLTDADGNWSFEDLDWTYAGKMIFEVMPSGYTQTLGAAGYEITGTSGADQTGLDFANFELFDISGTKYLDANGDGSVVGDSGLGGITIFIDLDDSGDFSAGDDSTITAADGSWSFTDLDWTYAGKFVFEVLPSGYIQTLGQAGYEITGTSGADQEGLDFANYIAVPARTPGFWSNHLTLWDGEIGNGPKQSGDPNDDFPDDELLYEVDSDDDGIKDTIGLLIGDYDRDGLTGPGEDTFFISLADAQSLVSANEKKMDDGVLKIGRDAVATWLNYLAFNADGSPPLLAAAEHFIDDAIDWLQVYGDDDPSNTNDAGEFHDSYISSHNKVKTNSAYWNSDGAGYPADHSGAEIHMALDDYNNDGVISVI